MTTPEFVVVGHVVRDLMPAGSRLGGTATFAAAQAHRLGLDCGIVTRTGADISLPDALPGVAMAGRPADVTTSFENSYEGPHRRQRVPVQAPVIEAEDVPPDWRTASIASCSAGRSRRSFITTDSRPKFSSSVEPAAN